MGRQATSDAGRRRGIRAHGPRRRGGRRAAVLIAALATLGAFGCGSPRHAGVAPEHSADLRAHVVATFERAVLDSQEAYQALFDFEVVGAYEKLLRRHDLLGRLPDLGEQARAELRADTPEPYPAPRERKNLGLFYPPLAQRTVGTGGCHAVTPVSAYGRKLGEPFEPLPPEHAAWDAMRPRLNALIENGGVVGVVCEGGEGRLALVYTRTDSARGFDLITLYDDVEGF